jgi:hypothetical protein
MKAEHPGLYVSPYFIFRNFSNVDIIRIGNMELYKNDQGPYPASLWDNQRLVTEMCIENDKTVVYLGRIR